MKSHFTIVKKTFFVILIGLFMVNLYGVSVEDSALSILQPTQNINTVPLNTQWDNLLRDRFAQDLSQYAESELGKRAIHWAQTVLNESPEIPLTTYSLYREFLRSGDRGKYEKPYFLKRSMLTASSILVLFKNDDSYLPLLNDLIWNICEETNWVLPAHERFGEYIFVDLFSAETATQLAHILLLLHDKLPSEIQHRIRSEVKNRVMQPYLEHAEDKYGWVRGLNNWTGVCAGSIGECFIILEQNEDTLRKAIQLVLTHLARFIQNAFAEDGGCLEGIAYWNYGLTHYISFGELLREVTQGEVNILLNPRIQQIAFYPYIVYLGHGKFASFSDAPSEFYPHPFIVHRLAETLSTIESMSIPPSSFTYHPTEEKLTIQYLHSLANPDPNHWLFGNTLRNVLWAYPYDNKPKPDLPLSNAYLPKSGIARLVQQTDDGTRLILICKAGSNGEPHNHNDVGSFIFAINDTVYLTDPGAGLYSRDYFGPKRYENIFANSYGHSVPVIAGKLQSPGEKYHGVMEYQETSVRIQFHTAYNIPSLTHLQRTFTFQNQKLILTDSFEFNNKGESIEEALLTWLPTKIHKNQAIIEGNTHNLIITSSEGKFEQQSLKDHCEQNRRPGELTRISITLPPKPRPQVTLTFQPLKK